MQFALHGYKGTSLSSIAGEVGIKKESIYSHFRSKEHLFKSTFEHSISREIEFIETFFSNKQSGTFVEKLERFITDYLNRYERNNSTKFFIRNSYFPPEQIKVEIIRKSYELTEKLETILFNEFQQTDDKFCKSIKGEDVVMAYLTILDGLFVEMLYGGISDRLLKRTYSSWKVFVEGIGYKK